MSKISSLSAYPILDSRGQTTIEVNIALDDGSSAVASVPSGTSTGKYEARSVNTDLAIWEVNQKILPLVINKDLPSQEALDKILKSKDFGANSKLSVSIAFAKAAKTLKYPSIVTMPKIMMLAMEGGKHGHGGLLIQEYLLVVNTIEEGVQIYSKLGENLEKEGLGSDVGLEGGFSPRNLKDEEVFELLNKIIGEDLKIGLDIAAGHLPKGKEFDYANLINNYPITTIEDPYSEDEIEKWKIFTKEYGSKILVIGDDLIVTNKERLKYAIENYLCNAIIIKPNQVGTISDTLEVIKLAKQKGFKIIVSHRSGETNDTFIADLAIAVEADYVKFGGPTRGERVAKYNRLLELERRWK